MNVRERLQRVFKETEEVNRRAILNVAEPRPGAVLADLGCGGGEFTQRVAARGLRLELARTAGFYPLPPRAAEIATRIAPRWGAFLVQRYGVAA